MNCELLDVQAGFRKGRGTRIQTANIRWIIGKKKKGNSKNTSTSLTTLKPLTVCIVTNSGNFLEMGIQNHLTCLLRNLHAAQEATVRTGRGTMDWTKIGKGVE